MTEGCFRVTSYIKQKIPQNPSTSFAGPPPLSGEAYAQACGAMWASPYTFQEVHLRKHSTPWEVTPFRKGLCNHPQKHKAIPHKERLATLCGIAIKKEQTTFRDLLFSALVTRTGIEPMIPP